MSTIPTRFIANEFKVNLIKNGYCGNCKLNRRTNLKQVLTPGNELGADIWNSKDIFGLSVNIDLCDKEKFPFQSHKDDVNIIPLNVSDEIFQSNNQLDKFPLDQIEVQELDTPIIYLVVNEIQLIKGTYPFKKGSPDEKIYEYKIQVLYKPMVLNVFHFQIEVLSNENDNWGKMSRNNKKKYIRALATKIRAQILDENKVYPLILS